MTVARPIRMITVSCPATFEIAARATAFTFTLEITADEVYELSETLELDLSFMAQALNLGMFARVVTIRNDEELPEVSLDAVGSLNEGDRHELTVRLSGALQSTATVTLIEQSGWRGLHAFASDGYGPAGCHGYRLYA